MWTARKEDARSSMHFIEHLQPDVRAVSMIEKTARHGVSGVEVERTRRVHSVLHISTSDKRGLLCDRSEAEGDVVR